MPSAQLPVAVLGAGPVGLAAAAHLVQRAIPLVLFEAGDDIAASIGEWAHVRLFSPWRHNVDGAARRLLDASGWSPPDDDAAPAGAELIEAYLRPLAAIPEIAGSLHLAHRVIAVSRLGMDKLKDADRSDQPLVVSTAGPDGIERTAVRAVIDATGTWRTPNPLGADGFRAIGEADFGDRIAYGIPDVLGDARARYAGRRVAVVGSGHSAQHAVLDLALLQTAHPDTSVTWVVRRQAPGNMFGGGRDDQLPQRGQLGSDARRLVEDGRVALASGFRVDEVKAADDGGVTLRSVDGPRLGPFAQVIAATGFRPDVSFLRELRLDLDPTVESARRLAPLIDPNIHSCGSVPPHGEAELRQPEPDVYVVGTKSYGRAPTFLLTTGYEQVRSVVAALAGDFQAARRLELVLPETGVCSTTTSAGTAADALCCRPAAPSEAASTDGSACCPSAAEPETVAAARPASSCCG